MNTILTAFQSQSQFSGLGYFTLIPMRTALGIMCESYFKVRFFFNFTFTKYCRIHNRILASVTLFSFFMNLFTNQLLGTIWSDRNRQKNFAFFLIDSLGFSFHWRRFLLRFRFKFKLNGMNINERCQPTSFRNFYQDLRNWNKHTIGPYAYRRIFLSSLL